MRQADRALNADIQSRVLSWVDCIAARSSKSAILPVVVIPQCKDMTEQEVKRRCEIMQMRLEEHVGRLPRDNAAPKLLTGANNILSVEYAGGKGLEQLQETILAIATDSTCSVFDHVGTPVPEAAAAFPYCFQLIQETTHLMLNCVP